MSSAHRSPAPSDNADNGRRLALDVSGQTDGELVRLAGKGNHAAWDELVHRFDRKLHGLGRRVGLSPSDAADAAQLTWMKLMGNLDEIRDPDRIGSWLATTARRESIRLAMSGSRQIPVADPMAERGHEYQCAAGVEATMDSLMGDYGPELRNALDRLPPKLELLIRLLYSEASLTYTEVSHAMGISVGSVGPMRGRALARLRRELEATVRGRAARSLPAAKRSRKPLPPPEALSGPNANKVKDPRAGEADHGGISEAA